MLQDFFTGHGFASDFILFEVFQPVEIVSEIKTWYIENGHSNSGDILLVILPLTHQISCQDLPEEKLFFARA